MQPHLDAREPASTTATILLALVVGVFVAVMGTIQHLHVVWIGSVFIPWGALLVLLMAGIGQLMVVVATQKLWGGGVTALITYTVAVAMAFWPGADTLAITVNELTWHVMPAEVTAEVLWLAGIPLVTVIVLFIARGMMRRMSPAHVRSGDSAHS